MNRIFIVAGQSNASGMGSLASVPVYSNASRIFNYANDNVLKPAVEPIDDITNQVDLISKETAQAGAGFCMQVANRVCDAFPNDTVTLVPCALGASGMKVWRPMWNRDYLYGSMVCRAWDALALGGEISGLLWWQGETDALTQADADLYLERTTLMFSALRSDLGLPLMPIVMARLNNNNPVAFPYWAAVAAYQNKMRMKNLAVVSTDGLAYQGTGFKHPYTADYVTYGNRAADALIPML